MKIQVSICLFLISCLSFAQENKSPVLSWTADNGNGTYTNPLFYDEFSDPDIIRVGDDFYMAGTTMHCMPGLWEVTFTIFPSCSMRTGESTPSINTMKCE
jgi:hypothetical protein